MSTNAKTFRLFISSTFNDFRLERQVLHEKVFPVIDNYCTKKGYTFQPVDLRWGVNDEAQLDQKTLDLCLNEVRTCKHYPHPNFLIMLGNRYGWVPLPYAIEKDEFESILKFHEDNNEAIKMLEEWYIEDTNHLMLNNSSHAYVIKERDPQGMYAEWESWEKIENELRTLLQDAANALFKSRTEYSKYFLSATEAEVEEGIFKYLQSTPFQTTFEEKFNGMTEIDKDYVYGFVRTIKDHEKADLQNEQARLFIDQDQTNVTKFRQELKDTLEAPNIHTAMVTLTDNKDNPIEDDSYLKAFELFMIEKLTDAVDKQIEVAQNVSALDQERSEQLRFKSLKTETFFGREEELKAVQDYIANPTTQPFIVHGISGIGKSSFIAKAIDQTEELLKHTVVAYRFIGATASSSNIRTLLESLITDIADQGILELPEAFEENTNKFNEQIKELLSDIEQPVVIILDALDQLQHKDTLQWLPLELPYNVKIILSMLDQKDYEHYYDLLKNKIDTNNQLEIAPLDKEVASEILDALLKKEKRTLTTTQKEYVLKQFHASHSSPLYLNIAFEEVKTWKSTDTTETLSVGIQAIIKEFINNLTDKFHHDRTIVHKLLGLISTSRDGLGEKEVKTWKSTDTTETLSVGIQAIIREFIDNLTDKFHHDRTVVHKILGLISASRDGLSEKEILDLLSRDEEILKSLEKFTDLTLEIDRKKVRRFPISIWARLSEQLRPFLNEKLIDGQNLITFFHRQIDEAVRDYIYEPNKQILHTELAEYFLTLQDKEQTWDKRYHNLHMLDEVPYQLYHAQDTERLKEILFDLEFAGSVYDHNKQVGFREIMDKASQLEGISKDEIHPWESFYREKEHLITKVYDMEKPIDLEGISENEINLWESFFYVGEEHLKVDEELFRPHQSLFQLSYEDGNNSPLSQKAESLLENDQVNFLWMKKKNRNEAYRRSGLLMVLEGHTNYVKGVEILGDGRILSYSGDNTLRLWSSEGSPLAMMKGHTNIVSGVRILGDGRILSYSWDKTLRLWSSEGLPLAVMKGHTNIVSGVRILGDGRILSYSSGDQTLWLWSSVGEALAALEGHSESIRGVEILDNGRILSYSDDKTLRLWSSEGEALAVLEGHTNEINGVEILGDGRILSYSDDKTLRLWSSEGEALAVFEGPGMIYGVEILGDGRILSNSWSKLCLWSSDGEALGVLEGRSYWIEGVEILGDGRILAYSEDKTLRLWSSEGEALAVLEGHNEKIKGVEILGDGRILSYAGDYTLRLWSREGEALAVLEGHNYGINGVEILGDGRILSYSLYELRLWSSEGEALGVLEGHTNEINGVEILSDGRILSYSSDKTLRLWSSEGGVMPISEGHNDRINGVEILGDGRILSYARDYTLRLWSREGEALGVLEGHTNYVNGAKVLGDGRILSYCGGDQTLRLWSAEGEALAVLEGHTTGINGVEILGDGRILSYSFYELRLWSSEGEALGALEGHTGRINGVEILGDGKILSYTSDYTLLLWSREGEALGVLEGHTNEINGVEILDDGRILSYSNDKTLRLWSGEGKALAVLEGHTSGIEGVEILDDGSILSYSNDHTLRLWSGEGEVLGVLKGHEWWINGVEILDDGRILSYSGDTTLRLWSGEGKALGVLEGHTDEIKGVEILGDGRIISYDDKTLRLWSGEGEALAVLEGHTGPINGVEILGDGRILTYDDKTIRLWNSEETQLNVLPLVSEDINFCHIKQETIIAVNGKYLLLYDFGDGSKTHILENIAQKSEALLYEDGI